MMRNEERRNEAEVRHRNLLVISIEIEDGRQVHRQKLQDIGKDCFRFLYIFVSLSVLYLVSNDTNDTDQTLFNIEISYDANF